MKSRFAGWKHCGMSEQRAERMVQSGSLPNFLNWIRVKKLIVGENEEGFKHALRNNQTINR